MKKVILFSISAILIFVATQVADSAYRSNTEWRNFDAFNAARSAYMDYPHPSYEEAPELYELAGWSEELTNAVEGWFFMDKRVTLEAFTVINENKANYMHLDEAATESPSVSSSLLKSVTNTYSDPMYFSAVLVGIGLALCAFALNLLGKRVWEALFSLAPMGANFCCTVIFAYIGRSPHRLLFAVLVCAAALTSYFLVDAAAYVHQKRQATHWKRGRSFGNIVVIVLSYVIVVACYSHITDISAAMAARDSNYRESVNLSHARDDYAVSHPAELYVFDTTLAYPRVYPLGVYGESDIRNLFFYGGSMMYSPLYYEQLDANGLGSFYADSFFDSNVRILSCYSDLADASYYPYLEATYGPVFSRAVDSISWETEQGEAFTVYVHRLSLSEFPG